MSDIQPFTTTRHDLLKAVRNELGKDARHYHMADYPDTRAIFRYDMHTLPNELSGASIGTSTLFAAWNAAVYVAQIEDERLALAVDLERRVDGPVREQAGEEFCLRRSERERAARVLQPRRLVDHRVRVAAEKERGPSILTKAGKGRAGR